ncbi:MAG: GNAT family N-acetyltransferase [Nitrososphaerota archaeon]|nr:GNAT family N-acetyltransferase [Nitrososphaerota archaeon]
MKMRQFSMKDYEQVRRVWEESGLEIRPGDSKEDVRRKVARDGGLFLVAEDGGSIVGTAMGAWDGRRGWIYHLGVLPGHQRKGIGSELVKEFEKRMIAKRVPKVNASVFDDNVASRALFEKMGFVPDRRSVLHGKRLGSG